MSDPSLDEIREMLEQSQRGDLGPLGDATEAILTKLFKIIVKQETALRRVVLVLDKDSDLRKRIESDGVLAHVHGAPDYQGTTLQEVLEWAKMGLD